MIKNLYDNKMPYINGEANGYAFSVKEGFKIPPSLQIIKNEIINSKVERDTSVNVDSNKWNELKHWRQQGVFLLNAALTVEKKNSDSHTGYWQWFTREVVKIISEPRWVDGVGKDNPVIWMLWGSKAQFFESYIYPRFVLKKNNLEDVFEIEHRNYNIVLKAYHPAAESRPNSSYKFTGCNHFNLCNQLLKRQNKNIINW